MTTPGVPDTSTNEGTSVPGANTVLSAILQQSFKTHWRPCERNRCVGLKGVERGDGKRLCGRLICAGHCGVPALAWGVEAETYNHTVVPDLDKLADDCGIDQAVLPDGDVLVNREGEKGHFTLILDQLGRRSNHRPFAYQRKPSHLDVCEVTPNDAVGLHNRLAAVP